jgi:cyanamide hydratase
MIHTTGLLVQITTQFSAYTAFPVLLLANLGYAEQILDNMRYRSDYIHPDTIKDVVKNYPRCNWSKCFSTKIREEVQLKPWCHTTASEEKFPHDVEHNRMMEPYDDL